jgi:hypothetical protein
MAALAAALLVSAPAMAQGWFMFEDKAERFTVNFPSQPVVTEIRYPSESGKQLPARLYRADAPRVSYSVTVVNYTGEDVTEIRGSVAFAAWNFRRRGGEITYDGYAQIDRVEGHQLQIRNADNSRTFIAVHLHDSRLFILEAKAQPGAPPPAQFQMSLGIFDAQGDRVRYLLDPDGQRTVYRQGGAYGENPVGQSDVDDAREERDEAAERARLGLPPLTIPAP